MERGSRNTDSDRKGRERMELYIVRHGETEWNKEHRLQGQTNIHLTEYGKSLARKTGEALKEVRIDKIYSSPLDRSYETALLIRGDRNIPIEKDDRLIELNFGKFEGKTVPELQNDDSTSFRYFFSEPDKYVADETGETLLHLCQRAGEFLKEKIEPMEQQWERVMIVGHGALNKALMSHIKQLEIRDFWSGGLQKNCNVMMVEWKNGIYRVIKEENLFYEQIERKRL